MNYCNKIPKKRVKRHLAEIANLEERILATQQAERSFANNPIPAKRMVYDADRSK